MAFCPYLYQKKIKESATKNLNILKTSKLNNFYMYYLSEKKASKCPFHNIDEQLAASEAGAK